MLVNQVDDKGSLNCLLVQFWVHYQYFSIRQKHYALGRELIFAPVSLNLHLLHIAEYLSRRRHILLAALLLLRPTTLQTPGSLRIGLLRNDLRAVLRVEATHAHWRLVGPALVAVSHLVLALQRLFVICLVDVFEAEVGETAVHEVHHVVLAEGLGGFQEADQAEVAR